MASSRERSVSNCKLLIACALSLAAAGCGKGDDKKSATQVAARVDSTEITVHQVNNVLARTPNIPADALPAAKREILSRLIDQQLLRQHAVQKKLDRSPAVMQTLEAAKTEILARAFAESVATAQPKPTDDEVKQYYAEHPELFAQRRVYQLDEILVAPKDGVAQGLKELLPKARTAADVTGWLKAQNVPFNEGRSVRAAEQIPLEHLAKLNAMKDGDMALFETGGRASVVRINASQSQPVDMKVAAPRIQQFLHNRRVTEAMGKELAQLKSDAKIEFAGEFAGALPPAAAKAPEPAKDAAAPEQSFEKGLKGLR